MKRLLTLLTVCTMTLTGCGTTARGGKKTVTSQTDPTYAAETELTYPEEGETFWNPDEPPAIDTEIDETFADP
ncbi:MAG: hypothetical protein IJ595_10620, partial [Oscillospiraceae bacterium]|nr:hypothetical protein [Oscillospiraceae bacterium]